MAKNESPTSDPQEDVDPQGGCYAQGQWDKNVPDKQPSSTKADAVDRAQEKPSIHQPQVRGGVDHQENALKQAGHRSHYK
jgi:hypothetical protein